VQRSTINDQRKDEAKNMSVYDLAQVTKAQPYEVAAWLNLPRGTDYRAEVDPMDAREYLAALKEETD
jgi:hypothetical protein